MEKSNLTVRKSYGSGSHSFPYFHRFTYLTTYFGRAFGLFVEKLEAAGRSSSPDPVCRVELACFFQDSALPPAFHPATTLHRAKRGRKELRKNLRTSGVPRRSTPLAIESAHGYNSRENRRHICAP